MITTFRIEGKIRGKDRPRMNTKTGNIHTTSKTRGYEAWIRESYRSDYQDVMHIGAITATIEAYYGIPKSIKNKIRREQMKMGLISPTIKPDLDNVAKVCLDALNGLAYEDDKQVTTLIVKKFYADEPYIRITLEGEI